MRSRHDRHPSSEGSRPHRSGVNQTLSSPALSQLQSGYYIDYSIVLTGAVMATLPLLVLFIVAGRQLISGIMQGAVKG